MQFHYVVIYDDELKTWHYSSEVTGYAFPDGEVYDPSSWFLGAYAEDTPVEVTKTSEDATALLMATLKNLNNTRTQLYALDTEGVTL